MNTRIFVIFATLALLVSTRHGTNAAGSTTPVQAWITGEVFTDGVLFFRADKLIPGNSTGKVVLLGTTKENVNILPVFMRAAEKKIKLRLYGNLLPFSGALPARREKLPNIQFIVSKIHLPSDPDELPANEKLIINPKDIVHFSDK